MRPRNPFTEAAAVPMKKTSVGLTGRSAGKVHIGRAFKGKSDAERESIIQHAMRSMRATVAGRGSRRELLRKKIKG